MKSFLQLLIEANEPKFETGKAVTFEYIRNKNKSPNMGSLYGQDIEPAGRYVNIKPSTFKSEGYPEIEFGSITFKNPLVVSWGGGYSEPTNWKKVLSEKYKGKKGRNLSKSIIKDGYDGIVVIEKNGHSSEIIDLTTFK